MNETVTTYVLHGKNVVHLTQGSNNLHFFYGADGSPAIVEYNGVSYGYVKNLQGDVIGIVNASGVYVVQYAYDAWGRLLSKTGSMASTLGTINPFRYRGYVYDEETGLYYLRSRYYNPTWCRFINADVITRGNQFAYCFGDPIQLTDANGMWGTNTTKLPATVLFCYLYKMLEDGLEEKTKWKYEKGQKKRAVDCIGMITYCAEQYFTKEAYKDIYLVRQGSRLARDVNKVGQFVQIDKNNLDTIPRGATLYYPDDSHVGVYVGHFSAPDGTEYQHGVIECTPRRDLHIAEFEDIGKTGFTKYCLYNYIDYDFPETFTSAYKPFLVIFDDEIE